MICAAFSFLWFLLGWGDMGSQLIDFRFVICFGGSIFFLHIFLFSFFFCKSAI